MKKGYINHFMLKTDLEKMILERRLAALEEKVAELAEENPMWFIPCRKNPKAEQVRELWKKLKNNQYNCCDVVDCRLALIYCECDIDAAYKLLTS